MKGRHVVTLLVIGLIVVITLIAILSPGDGAGVSLAGAAPVVALVRVEGVLATGLGATSLLSATTGSDAIVSTLSEVGQNPSVEAVVLRVNSPGGSPAAAQEISEEIAALREEGKIVVTSMGDTAASGAYWIAAGTDHIMADAGTMTGSIGVLWEVANYEELYRKLGISYVHFTSGPHKDMGSPARELTPEERDIMKAMVDDLYNQFVDVVATGRDLPRQSILGLADGRVFTGSQAKALGLVDSLGGLKKATAKAAEMAGIADYYRVQEFGRRSAWEIFLGEARAYLGALLLQTPAGAAGGGLLEGPQ